MSKDSINKNDKMSNDGGGTYMYQVCEEGSENCSNKAYVTF